MKTRSNIFLAALILVITVSCFAACGKKPTAETTPTVTPTPTEAPFETASESVKNMVIGWNLGNYFDATAKGLNSANVNSFLTCWGNPIVDESLFAKLKSLGFNAVRIPITWNYHFADNGTIHKIWMDKVKECVDWAIANDLYVIINIHHDTGSDGWIRASMSNYEKNKDLFAALWKNIAETFKDYPEKLLFEGFNEMLDEKNEWNNPTTDANNAINSFNQLFVDTVRATGGKNAERNLVCNTYAAANTSTALKGFKVPTDTVENHIIGQVHFYSPYEFVTDEGITWTKPIKEYTDYVQNTVDDTIRRTANVFDRQHGIPVIIGEFAADDKGNTADRIKWYSRIISDAKFYGMTCFIWDNGHGYNMGHIDRTGSADDFPEIIKACVDAAK